MKRKNLFLLSLFLIFADANADVYYPPINSYSPFFNNLYISIGEGVAIPSRNSSTTADSSTVLFLGTFPGSSIFSLPNVRWNNNYKTGFEGDILLGNHFTTNLSAEAEFLYQNFKRNINGGYGFQEVDAITDTLFAQNFFVNPAASASDRAQVYSLLANLRYDWINSSYWTPYIGAGFGAAWLNSGSTTARGTLIVATINAAGNVQADTSPTLETSPSLYGSAFAWQFKAGIDYRLSDSFSLGAQYRLFGTSDFKASNSRIISNPLTPGQSVFNVPQNDIKGLLSNSVDLTLTYHFVQLPTPIIPAEYIK